MTTDRVTVPPNAFIRKTGQVWKLVVGTIVLPFVVVAIVLLQMRRLDRPTAELLPWFGVVLVAIALIVGLLASIACPRCKQRLFWQVFTDPDSNAAITAFLSRRDCAKCGHTP